MEKEQDTSLGEIAIGLILLYVVLFVIQMITIFLHGETKAMLVMYKGEFEWGEYLLNILLYWGVSLGIVCMVSMAAIKSDAVGIVITGILGAFGGVVAYVAGNFLMWIGNWFYMTVFGGHWFGAVIGILAILTVVGGLMGGSGAGGVFIAVIFKVKD